MERVLEFQEAGRTEGEILSQFPSQTEEVRAFLHVISRLEEQRQMQPPVEVLKKILSGTPAIGPRAAPLLSRMSHPGKGRISFITLISDQIHNGMGLKLGLVGVVLIVVIVVLFMRLGGSTMQSPMQTQQAPEQTAMQNTQPTAPVTGNPDDAVNAIISGGASEQMSVNGEDADSSMAAAETSSISEFDAVYDANEF